MKVVILDNLCLLFYFDTYLPLIIFLTKVYIGFLQIISFQIVIKSDCKTILAIIKVIYI